MNYETHSDSVLKGITDLPSGPKHFLVFTAVNLISWQCVVGQAMVLFGRAIGMPASWIGVLISFLPLSLLLVIISIPAVESYGPRKMLIRTWLARNLLASLVFIIPGAIPLWGHRSAWYILIIATLGFSLARSLGVGAWYPWIHEIVPQKMLGAYFSAETILVQIINVALTFVIAYVLNQGTGLNRFYWVYFIGIFAGLASIGFMRRIPGGVGVRSVRLPTSGRFSRLVRAFKDKSYRWFILNAIISASSISWISASNILYLRDMLFYSDSTIMYIVAAGAFFSAFTVLFWKRYPETVKINGTLALLITGHSLITFLWCALIHGAKWTPHLSVAAVLGNAVFSSIFSVTVSRGMMCLVKTEERVGYTSLWVIGMAFSNGIPPILVGLLIDLFHLDGFRACFLISSGIGLFSALLWGLMPADKIQQGKINEPVKSRSKIHQG